MGITFDLSAIPNLNKTNATKELMAAVRDSQNAPRACYKSNACPSWWKSGQTVVLPDGSSVAIPQFGNPRDLSVDEVKAALSCYYSFKSNIPITIFSEMTEAQNSVKNNDNDENEANQQVTTVEPSPPPPLPRSGARQPLLKRKQKAFPKSVKEPNYLLDDPVLMVSQESTGRDIEVSNGDVSTKESTEKSARLDEGHGESVSVSEDMHKKRLAYLEKLRSEYAALEYGFNQVIRKQKDGTRRFVDDFRSNMNFTVARLQANYEVASLLPPEFLNMTMEDIVHKYDLDLDTWLQVNVTRGVEAAMRYVRVDDDVGEDDATGSGYHRKENGLPCKTPPARTPAARRRRENIQDTIIKTAKKVRMADEKLNSDVMQQRSEATKVALANILGGSGRATRSNLQSGMARVGASATVMATARKARKGETVVTYSMNGSPVQKRDSDVGLRSEDNASTPIVTRNVNNDANSRIQALLSMAEDIPKTIRQVANPEKHIAYLRRQLDEAEAELKRERC